VNDDETPRCLGRWVAGSGGHRAHALDCDRVAMWWHPDDAYAYCDEHVPPSDREWFERQRAVTEAVAQANEAVAAAARSDR
jgi:hypothetical protein